MQVECGPIPDVAALEHAWRALEAEVPDLAFFQSWTWVGCCAGERFPDPVLLRASVDGRLRTLALFNRRGGALHLGASGVPALDAPYVEHNAPLLAPGMRPEILAAAWRLPGVRRLVLPGVPPGLVAVVGGIARRCQVEPAPRIDLRAVPGGDYLAGLSGNTRYQIRRALRRLAETAGPPRLERAATLAEAEAWLDALIALHQAGWQRRGRPGAFADGFMRRFHRTLLARGLPRGEIDLLRISAGATVVGYLYNFRSGRTVCAYQSGFAPADPADPHAKPGLVCHSLAIQRALADGMTTYDFLAGEARYKRSLANAETRLAWAELVPARSLAGLLARGRRALAARRSGGAALP